MVGIAGSRRGNRPRRFGLEARPNRDLPCVGTHPDPFAGIRRARLSAWDHANAVWCFLHELAKRPANAVWVVYDIHARK